MVKGDEGNGLFCTVPNVADEPFGAAMNWVSFLFRLFPSRRERAQSYAVAVGVLSAVFLTGIVGVWALMDVPVLGVRLAVFGGGVRVSVVDNRGPAAGLIFPGEILRSIGDIELDRDDLMRFPTYPRASTERDWWHRQKAIYSQLRFNQPVSLVVASAARGERTLRLESRKRSLSSVLRKGAPIYLSGLLLVFMAVMTPTHGRGHANRLAQLYCALIGLYHVANAPMVLKETVLNPHLRHGLTYVSFLAVGVYILMVHWALIFPKRKKILKVYPWLVGIPYVYYGASVVLYLAGATGFGSAMLGMYIWPVVFLAMAFHAYCSEEDLLLKQRTLFFLMIPILLALFFAFYLAFLGKLWTNPMSYPFFVVLSILFGFSIILAGENQRIYYQSLEGEQRHFRDRLQMAREMHDNFSNVLAGIVRLAGRSEHGKAMPDTGERVLPQIKQAAQNSLTEVRNFIAAVEPVSCRWEDYVGLCREQALETLEPFSIQLVFQSMIETGCEMLRPLVQYHLTGIIREALGNVIKHAGASHVVIRLTVQGTRGELRIEDDGVGFDGRSVSEGHYGVAHMAGRAKELGGHLAITPLDRGTRISVHFIP